jgi:DNA-binding XRE family transcriptional regulator
MSPEQILELQRRLKKDREIQKKVALELRKKGKTQEEVANIVGVTPKTIYHWEKGEDASFRKFTDTCPPDLRLKLTREQKQDTPASWEKMTLTKVTRLQKTVRKVRRVRKVRNAILPGLGSNSLHCSKLGFPVRKVRNAILPGLGLLKKMTVCMSLLGLLKKVTVCISIKVWMPKG